MRKNRGEEWGIRIGWGSRGVTGVIRDSLIEKVTRLIERRSEGGTRLVGILDENIPRCQPVQRPQGWNGAWYVGKRAAVQCVWGSEQRGEKERRGQRKVETTMSRGALWAMVRILVFTLRELGAMGEFWAEEGLSFCFFFSFFFWGGLGERMRGLTVLLRYNSHTMKFILIKFKVQCLFFQKFL